MSINLVEETITRLFGDERNLSEVAIMTSKNFNAPNVWEKLYTDLEKMKNTTLKHVGNAKGKDLQKLLNRIDHTIQDEDIESMGSDMYNELKNDIKTLLGPVPAKKLIK
jgi:hypothetical protein